MTYPSRDRTTGRRLRPRARLALPLCAALLLMAAAPLSRAKAADWPESLEPAPLRGSYTSPGTSGALRWEGINFGGTFGLTSMSTDFGNSTSQQVAYILRNSTLENEARPSGWTTLPQNITNSQQYGAFIGYSVPIEDIILGVDVGYNRMSSAEANASDTLSRIVTTSDNVQHGVTISAQSSMKLIDYATARVRAGWAVGQFLPYAFVGGAVGRFNYSNSSTVTSNETPPAPAVPYTFGPVTQTDGKNNALVGGFTAGLGLDVAILPNVFLRAEWEYVGFAQVSGIRSSINTGRAGIGMRF